MNIGTSNRHKASPRVPDRHLHLGGVTAVYSRSSKALRNTLPYLSNVGLESAWRDMNYK